MSLFWQRERENVDRRRSLESVPVFNEGVSIDAPDANPRGAVLRVPFHSAPGWMDRFRPKMDSRRYELDEFGAFVVRLVNGKRTVLDIIDRFQREFGMSRRESELGVVAFIKMLMRRRLVSVGLKPLSREPLGRQP